MAGMLKRVWRLFFNAEQADMMVMVSLILAVFVFLEVFGYTRFVHTAGFAIPLSYIFGIYVHRDSKEGVRSRLSGPLWPVINLMAIFYSAVFIVCVWKDEFKILPKANLIYSSILLLTVSTHALWQVNSSRR